MRASGRRSVAKPKEISVTLAHSQATVITEPTHGEPLAEAQGFCHQDRASTIRVESRVPAQGVDAIGGVIPAHPQATTTMPIAPCEPTHGESLAKADGFCRQDLATTTRVESRFPPQGVAAGGSITPSHLQATTTMPMTPCEPTHGESLAEAYGFCRQGLASAIRVESRFPTKRVAANGSVTPAHPQATTTMPTNPSEPTHGESLADADGFGRQDLVSTIRVESRVPTQRVAANGSASDHHSAHGSTSGFSLAPNSEIAHDAASKSEFAKHQGQRVSSNGEGYLRVTMEAPPGKTFVMCPCLPYRIENSFHVKVVRANFVPPSTSDMGRAQIQLTGEWKRASVGAAARWGSDAAIVVLTLSADLAVSAGAPRVIEAQGPGRFARCAKEQWILSKVAGNSLCRATWINQLIPGAALILQRPHERAFVLRKPDLQIPRLLAEIADECHSNNQLNNDSNAARLLAAPAGGGSGVAMMAAMTTKDCPLLSKSVSEELEDRFGVVFAQPDHCAENVLAENASEGLLRQLLAYGLAGVLHRRGWIFVDTPLRLCLSDVLGGQSAHRANVRVPSIDVACSAAWIESGNLICDIVLRPAVRLAQPLDGFLANPENREAGSLYAVANGTIASHQPPIHVLPQLTAASITHIYYGGLSNATDLPVDLHSTGLFSDYWRLVHGYRLPPSALTAFARVQFQNGDLSLTYPLACLWRHQWSLQPMQSKSHAPKILQLVMLSLKQFALLGGPQKLQLVDGPSTLMHQSIPEQSPAFRPVLLPISRAHMHTSVEARRVDPPCLERARHANVKRGSQEDGDSEELATKASLQLQQAADGDRKRRRLLLPLREGP